jgi:hypothetical protein
MGSDMDNYALCESLLKAETENEVEAVLEEAGYMADDPAIWQPFGGFGMNLNQINNQQSDPTAALVEKLINSIDAVLMGECYKSGIDPKGSAAPRTMAQAVDRLFKVKEGRLEHLTARERTLLGDRIHFVATGSKKEPCYLIADSGEGQTPASFKETFLSLTKQNKDDIPFVSGAVQLRRNGCPAVLWRTQISAGNFTPPAILPCCRRRLYKRPLGRHDRAPPASCARSQIINVRLPGPERIDPYLQARCD